MVSSSASIGLVIPESIKVFSSFAGGTDAQTEDQMGSPSRRSTADLQRILNGLIGDEGSIRCGDLPDGRSHWTKHLG